jgi:hypothetical protein
MAAEASSSAGRRNLMAITLSITVTLKALNAVLGIVQAVPPAFSIGPRRDALAR